jgi:peptidoglycan hydrolase-like protein with peptidoglycan-binding domain
MGIVILILFALLALASVNGCESVDGDGDFDFGLSDEANATDGTSATDGLPTCDGVVVIDVGSEAVRVPGDTDVFSSPSTACEMSVDQGDEDAVVLLQDALNRCNREDVAVDGQYGPQTAAAVTDVQQRAGIAANGVYGPATLEAMRWPVSTSGGTECASGASSRTSSSGTSSETNGGGSSLPPTG